MFSRAVSFQILFSLPLFFPSCAAVQKCQGKNSSVITINYCSTFPKQSKFMLWISYSVMVNPTQLTLKECEGVFVYVSLAIKSCQKPSSVKETTRMQKEETDRESLKKGWVKCECVCTCVWERDRKGILRGRMGAQRRKGWADWKINLLPSAHPLTNS